MEYDINILNYKSEHGRIKSITDLEHYCSMKRKEILQNHQATITELQTGKYKGYYQTFYYDDKTNGRRILRAKTRKQLDDKLVSLYMGIVNSKKHTIEECFWGWIDYLSIDKKRSTIRIYKSVFKRHFESIKDLYIEDMTGFDIKTHAKKEVANNKLTQKGYSAYKTNLLGIWHYAKDKGYISLRIEDITAELKRELKKSFYPPKNLYRQDEDRVLSDSELNKLIEYCLNSKRLVDYGICLITGTGLRIGELAALKKSDISPDRKYLLITKTEERVSDGADYEVSDKPKTEAGLRKVLLTSDMVDIVGKILMTSDSNSEYLFSDKELSRYPTKKFRDRLYRICKYVDIPKRSPHALRRTYATMLYEMKVPEELIIRQMGHVDIDITKKNYIFNRRSNDELISILENGG